MSAYGAEAAVAAAGGQVKLAEALGVSQQSVSEWVRRGWFPLNRARTIAETYTLSIEHLVKPELAAVIGKRDV